jgi:hypothetical protein
MLGTIILDAYRTDERKEVVAALDELCSPRDLYGWASAGVYCFWNRIDRTILYIGLSVDLPLRFREHNRLRKIVARGNKAQQIDTYFAEVDYLGFSIFLQSPMAQSLSARALLPFGADGPSVRELYGHTVAHGTESIRRAEGIWLEAHRQAYGWLPPWNRIGGLAKARVDVGPTTALAFDVLTGRRDSLIAARHTLREIAASPTLEGVESFLHGARQLALPFGRDIRDFLEGLPGYDERREYIESENYLQRSPQVPGP